MSETLKVRRLGGSLAVVLPKAVTEALALSEGDDLYVTLTPDGLTATPYDPSFDEALEAARGFMHDYRDTFKALAS